MESVAKKEMESVAKKYCGPRGVHGELRLLTALRPGHLFVRGNVMGGGVCTDVSMW